jgi:sarcosine oxidase
VTSARGTAAVVGAGVLGLSTARALREDGFAVTVYEQHAVGTPLGGSHGLSRIYRISYRHDDYVRLARRAIEEWRRLDPGLLLQNGLVEYGEGLELHAAALERCGEAFEWLTPDEAQRLFPEARFPSDVFYTREAGAILADRALAALATGLDVQAAHRIEDPWALTDTFDVVCVCAGAWLGGLVDLPLSPRIEQVAYLRGIADGRPSLVDHRTWDGTFWYGLVSPGTGYKFAQDGSRPGRFDPDRSDRPVREDLLAVLRDHVRQVFPGIDPEPAYAEACMYTMTPDEDFILDLVNGVVVCGGDSGHAFKFGPLLGRLCADLAQGVELPPEARRFRASRFGERVA